MSASKWETVHLEDIKAPEKYSLIGGPFGSNLVKRDYVEKGVPVIRGANIAGDNLFTLDDLVYVSEEKADKLISNNAHAGDIVFTQRGTLGQIGIIPENSGFKRFVISQSQMKLTVDEAKAIPKYVYYYFKSPDTVQTIHNLAISAGVPHINLQILREFEIPLPPLPTQQKIAAVLSAYDDLIENNTRRIQILEEMAQAIYRQWFVEFKYPGHEDVPLVDSGTALGEIPQGWEVKKLGDLADVNRESISKANAPEQINYVDISSVSTGQIDEIRLLDFADAPSRARRTVKHGDVIYATVRPNRKSFSLIIQPVSNLIVSTGFAVLTAVEVPFTFLYYAVTTDEFVDYLTNRAQGAAYPAVNAGDFKSADFIIPPEDLLDKFDKVVQDMVELKHGLLAKNGNLRATRDLLLPRLVSGEVDVSALEIVGE